MIFKYCGAMDCNLYFKFLIILSLDDFVMIFFVGSVLAFFSSLHCCLLKLDVLIPLSEINIKKLMLNYQLLNKIVIITINQFSYF